MAQNTKFDFTKAVKEIEEINQWFQNEDIDLDVGLEKFKRGLDLIKECRTRLKQVENGFINIKNEYDISEKDAEKVEESEKESSSDNIHF